MLFLRIKFHNFYNLFNKYGDCLMPEKNKISRVRKATPLPSKEPEPINGILTPLTIFIYNNNGFECRFKITNSSGYIIECKIPGSMQTLANGESYEFEIPDYQPFPLLISPANPANSRVSVLVENITSDAGSAEMEYFYRAG